MYAFYNHTLFNNIGVKICKILLQGIKNVIKYNVIKKITIFKIT